MIIWNIVVIWFYEHSKQISKPFFYDFVIRVDICVETIDN